MNRKDAEKLAEAIFDMIDKNYPRGLIKSDLVDLIAGFKWDDKPDQAAMDQIGGTFRASNCTGDWKQYIVAQTGPGDWITLEEALSEVEILSGGLAGGDLSEGAKIANAFSDMTKDDHWTEEVMERLHEVNRHFGKDLCDND